jgi:hypothetical protein
MDENEDERLHHFYKFYVYKASAKEKRKGGIFESVIHLPGYISLLLTKIF